MAVGALNPSAAMASSMAGCSWYSFHAETSARGTAGPAAAGLAPLLPFFGFCCCCCRFGAASSAAAFFAFLSLPFVSRPPPPSAACCCCPVSFEYSAFRAASSACRAFTDLGPASAPPAGAAAATSAADFLRLACRSFFFLGALSSASPSPSAAAAFALPAFHPQRRT